MEAARVSAKDGGKEIENYLGIKIHAEKSHPATHQHAEGEIASTEYQDSAAVLDKHLAEHRHKHIVFHIDVSGKFYVSVSLRHPNHFVLHSDSGI